MVQEREREREREREKEEEMFQLLTPVCICVVAFIGYALFGHMGLLYEQPIAGMLPIDMAVMVLVKQVCGL